MADHTTLVRELFEAWNKRDYEAVAQRVAPDCTMMDMGNGRTLQGPDGFLEFSNTLFAALPDMQFSLDHLMTQGDTVVIEYTGRGTHTGDLVLPAATIPATGRSLTVHTCEVDEVENGKIKQARVYLDSGAIMAQLGITERLGVNK